MFSGWSGAARQRAKPPPLQGKVTCGHLQPKNQGVINISMLYRNREVNIKSSLLREGGREAENYKPVGTVLFFKLWAYITLIQNRNKI